MTKWTFVKDRAKYAVAVCNFKQNGPYRLHLTVGDTVHILQEKEDWFYGCCTKNKNVWGIFPKSYVVVKESIVDKTGPHEAIIPREPPIVQEITSVIREWGIIWKQLYIMREPEFQVIRNMMYELIEWRRKIMSGTLPVDELKELKQKATTKIDVGNAILGLDLVVRDEHGNMLNPDITSAIDLYRAHELATQRIKLMASNSVDDDDNRNQKSLSRHVHSFYVTVKNFVCRIGDDADLLMTLYDAKEGRCISESYLVKWSKEGLAKDLEQLNNLRVLFTDLGIKDLQREKMFLICQIIRIGSMELKDCDHKRSTHIQRKASDGLRRPFGVAAMEITDIMNGKLDIDEEKQYFIPFVQCNERDFLDNLLRKVLTMKEITQKEHKGQGLWVCLKLLHGDIKQVKEENPHLISTSTAVARKMGFPDIILPGDVRNDLYLTISHGEFTKGAKSSDRNIEVSVKVLNEKGQLIPNVISMGCGSDTVNEYKSVIYYHEDKPKWMENVKIAIPIEEFYSAHLKFTFKHRSSNDAKDRAEKAFAVSFVKLMHENGTTLKDEVHELLVYKIDYKRFDDSDISYINLPSTRQELEKYIAVNCPPTPNKNSNSLISLNGLTLSSKDSFYINSLVCSTKLTQNVDLLGLLKWWSNPENLKNNLLSLMKVDGEEIVKFLQDTLDALFNILMQNSDSELYDNLVFEALIFIIGLVSDRKYHHFRPILDLYIRENFSATLTYNKLIVVLKYYVDNALQKENQETLLRTMKSIEYIFKFIVRSRQLFAALNEDKGRESFEISMNQLLHSITSMMLYDTDSTLLVQGACLKYFPFTIPDILSVFDGLELSNVLVKLINNVPRDRLTKQKMMCVNDLVHSDLFRIPECRLILLPMICNQIKNLLERKDEMELSIKIMSDIMIYLYGRDVGATHNDISEIMLSILRTIIQCVVHLERKNSLVGNVVATMISVLRQMTPYHYSQYINNFSTKTDLLDFIMEILLVFRDLVNKSVYPSDWNEMIMLQNSVILKALRHFSVTIRDRFTNPFEIQVWNNFFHCAIAFLTQDALQLENFSPHKRNKIVLRYKDMRRETAFEIRAMWFNLGPHQIHFVPGMVGPFLEMTLIPEVELRKATIPIFFDMMQCEFYSHKGSTSSYSSFLHQDDFYISNREIKYSFDEFEHEMITKLDTLVEGGRGDEEYKDLFLEIVGGLCENHQTMHEKGMAFVRTVVRLMKRLLEYRMIVTDENKENRMSCTVNLLEFYHEINRREMYIRYLYKLCDLHLDCENYVEAAFTLKLHAKLLRWSEEPLSQLLKNDKYPNCETHRELKECLYYDILDYFDKGKLWESGLALCKELAVQYENEVFDYIQLSILLKRMAAFYDNIMKQVRPEPEYFRVSYYGRGFASFLQNKTFIYRGKEYERLSDFSSRLLNQYPNAKLMTKLAPPGEDITESDKQYLQINKVDPVMHERDRFRNKNVHDQIMKYYKVNEVQKFTYSRPLRRGEKDSDNEFATMWLERTNLVISYPLPGILHWFPVTSSQSIEISPLENAIETMEMTNKRICNLVLQHRSDPMLPISPLSMLLNGVVDAAVMGGIINYEKAFFTEEYAQTHNTRKDAEGIQRLKDLIACQVPLLEAGITIHKQKAPENLKPFHQHMEEAFLKLRTNIEEKYGKKDMPAELQERAPITIRRVKTVPSKSNMNERISDTSNFSLESPRRSVQSNLSISSLQSSKTSPSVRGASIFVKPISSSSSKSSGKKSRESSTLTLRRSSGPSISQNHEAHSQSQWYDISPTTPKADGPVIELSEQLTPQRPLRSEVEKRQSRPSSGQFRHQTPSPTGMNRSPSASLYSLSLPSTPSTLSCVSLSNNIENNEEKPPPLPQKQAYSDYTNITEDMQFNCPTRKNSMSLTLRAKNKPPPPLPVKEGSLSPKSPNIDSECPPELPKRPHIKPPVDVTES
ncbi:Dedicator of cytokinesis protein 1 like protein [Argiope bruennichi]|uniref:Dedicator of cytokinesis protein 1 like protein n=1 Tax=Argiope bruennichi TaxID=94029 RepID=A0A8T0FX67_ARGBR|nr:Dedicator of cytokinesis protein 1 like protein [Argiope bruennichi]